MTTPLYFLVYEGTYPLILEIAFPTRWGAILLHEAVFSAKIMVASRQPEGVNKHKGDGTHGDRANDPAHEPDAAEALGRTFPGGIHGDIGIIQTGNSHRREWTWLTILERRYKKQ